MTDEVEAAVTAGRQVALDRTHGKELSMTTGPGYNPPRPHEPDPTRKHPLGEHERDEQPATRADHEQSDNNVDARIASSGQRPYGGDPHPNRDDDELPGEWHDHEINQPTDR
jgi:hypothetical protein